MWPGVRLPVSLLLIVIATPATGRAQQPAHRMTIQIDTATRRLRIHDTLRLAPTPSIRDSVEFVLWSRMQDVTARLVEPDGLGPLAIRGVGEGDRRWFVRPTRPFPAGRPIVLSIDYRSDSVAAPRFAVMPAGAFAGGFGELWYPQVSFAQRDVGRLTFTGPPGFVVVAPGRVVSGTVEAARGVHAFEVDEPAKFAFAAGPYRATRAQQDDFEFVLYTLRNTGDTDRLAKTLGQGLRGLEEVFGPLPTRTIAIVEVNFPGPVIGSCEFGFILTAAGRIRGVPDLPYWLHELGHQWWGVRIRTKPGGGGRGLLSEGMAQYGMHRALETIEGTAAAKAYRRGTYPGTWDDDSPIEYFRLAAAELDRPLTAPPADGRETVLLHQLFNARGFLVLDMLARFVGQQRFDSTVRQFAARHYLEATSWTEFRDAIAAGDQEVERFISAWFDGTGAPTFTVEWVASGPSVRGTVRQTGKDVETLLEIEARGGGPAARRTIAVRGVSTAFAWDLPFEPDSLIVDPDYRVLRWTAEWRAEAEALAPVTRAGFDGRYGDRDEAIGRLRAVLDSVPVPDPYAVRFRAELTLARLTLAAGDSLEARGHFLAALAAPLRPTHLLPEAYVGLARSAVGPGDAEALRMALAGAIEADAALENMTDAAETVRRLLDDSRSRAGP